MTIDGVPAAGREPPGALPRISLVVPSFNAVRTVERTLRSLLDQGYPALQLICVDGASRDGTVEILERHRPALAHLVSEPDRGPADALNKGFRLADGELLGWLNADDALAPGALRTVARAFLAHPEADVVTGGCYRFYADGSRVETAVPDRFVERMALRNPLEQPSTFWRAAVHRAAGELDASMTYAFDWEWWNRLLVHGARFVRIPEVLSHYYFSEDNLTSRGGQKVVEEMYRITRRYGPFGGRVADVYRFLYRHLDLRGWFDAPRTLPPVKRWVFRATLSGVRLLFGRDVRDGYNWNWASKQARGLVWYR